MILAGDVGGTKTRLALYETDGKTLKRLAVDQYPSASSTGLTPIVKGFLEGKNVRLTAACFGIPGPVVNGMARTTNLPWLLSESELSRDLEIPTVKLVNDLLATTASVPHLTQEGLITIHAGSEKRERLVSAVLAPGTGTGQGYLVTLNGRSIALASEGGHVNFAPTSELEDELLLYLREKVRGRVSVERVLCGPGLVNIYEFLKHTGVAPEPAALAQQFVSSNPAAVISAAGLSGEYDLCVKALDLFAHILGSHAGDLVLAYMSTGGLYLGGGMPPKIAPKLQDGRLLGGYLNKGRLTDVVKSTPLYIIKDDHAALLGAASIASELVQ